MSIFSEAYQEREERKVTNKGRERERERQEGQMSLSETYSTETEERDGETCEEE